MHRYCACLVCLLSCGGSDDTATRSDGPAFQASHARSGPTPPLPDLILTVSQSISASDGAAGQRFGRSASSAGDVNADGHDDVIVGAPGPDASGALGAAYVYLGSEAGVSESVEQRLGTSRGVEDDEFGISVTGAGDVDGDGFDDVAVGASDYSGGGSGRVYLYLGAADGVDPASEVILAASDGEAGEGFGWAVSGAGDVNGDGFDDLFVGAPHDDFIEVGSLRRGTGAAYVVFGAESGSDDPVQVRLEAPDRLVGDRYGTDVSSAGDIDGDGFADVIVGAPGRPMLGSAFIHFGAEDGPSLEGDELSPESTAHDRLAFGQVVAGIGDVDGDGHGDVAVGGTRPNQYGEAFVYLGGAGGIDVDSGVRLAPPSGHRRADFGASLSGAGDLDADGFDDLIVGAPSATTEFTAGGGAFLYLGSADGIPEQPGGQLLDLATADFQWVGYSVGAAGDIDGDGQADLILGGPDFLNAWGTGVVHVARGTCERTVYRDADGDGDGNPDDHTTACAPYPDGLVISHGDCDDTSPAIWSGAPETCNDIDDDCDGFVDVGVVDGTRYYVDADEDGHGNPDLPTDRCVLAPYLAELGDDCNDSEPLAWTGATEVCDHVDNDCNGITDADAVDKSTWYADNDGDHHGDASSTTESCVEPTMYDDDPDDCDDTDPKVYPGAEEIPGDGIDQDCDGTDLVEKAPRGWGCGATPRAPAVGWLLGLVAMLGRRRRG